MAGFLLPLFLALLLVVMFGPLDAWFRRKCVRHDRIAALLTTTTILLLVLVPILLMLAEAAYDAQAAYRMATAETKSGEGKSHQLAASDITKLAHWGSEKIVEHGGRLGMNLDRQDLEDRVGQKVQQFLAPLAMRTTQFLGEALMGLFVMVLATYYFFADGRTMMQAVLRLSPIEGDRTRELIDQFDSVTRAVVVATLLSAFVQGLLAGVGYYMAGVGSVFLLTALTMLFTLVPFVGAAIIWVPVCLWLFAVQGHTVSAVVLARLLHDRRFDSRQPRQAFGAARPLESPPAPGVAKRPGRQFRPSARSAFWSARWSSPFWQTLLNMVHAELGKLTKQNGLAGGLTSGSEPPT